MKSRNWLTNIGLLALLSFGYGCQNPQIDRIDINGKSIGNKIPTSLYGVFLKKYHTPVMAAFMQNDSKQRV